MAVTFVNSSGCCMKCAASGLFSPEQRKEHLVLSPECAMYFGIRIRKVIRNEEPSDIKKSEGEDITAALAKVILMANARRESPKPYIIDVLSAHLMADDHYFTFSDTNDMVFYDDEKGHYVFGGENRIRQLTQAIIDTAGYRTQITTSVVNEIIGVIQRSTFIDREKFEEQTDLVNLSNGVLNIRTREFTPHTPTLHFLTKVEVAYEPYALCPQIDAFLGEVLSSEDIPIIYELAGYLLRRDYAWQKAFMMNGTGSNGKSTLLKLLTKFIGQTNVSSVSIQDFAENRFACSNLYNKHANVYADISANALKDTGQLKMLTGGDYVYGEKKFKDAFTFVNYAKLIFSCNTLPLTYDDSDAFYRRWIIIDFVKQFVGKAEKKNLLAELTMPSELSGFLNKALEGLARLEAQNDFSNSKTIEEMRLIYRRKSDSVAAWAMDETETSIEARTPKSEMWAKYLNYCGRTKLMATNEKGFWMRIKKLFNVEEERPTSGEKREKVIRGLKMKDNGETHISEQLPTDDIQIPINPIDI